MILTTRVSEPYDLQYAEDSQRMLLHVECPENIVQVSRVLNKDIGALANEIAELYIIPYKP